MPVVSTVTPQTVDTGFKVEYRVDEVNADGSAKTGGEGTLQDTPALTVDLTELTPENNVAYYKTVAVITSTSDDSVTVTVESTNTVGVLMVESGAKTTAIAVPWEALGGGDISVSNIVRTANLTPGDELKAYDKTTGKYQAWTLSAGKTWEPSITTTSGSTTLADGADAYKVKRGSAVWLTRKGDTTQPIYLVGEVAATAKAEVTLDAGSATEPSWNLVGSAGTEPVSVSDLNVATTDKIVVPTAYIPKEYEYVDGKGWGYRRTSISNCTSTRRKEEKTMKTLKFMLMLAATVAAGAVRAEVDSYLYWMVSDDMKYVWEAPDKPGTPVTYDYAKISADGGDTYLTFYGTDGELPGVDTLDKGRGRFPTARPCGTRSATSPSRSWPVCTP